MIEWWHFAWLILMGVGISIVLYLRQRETAIIFSCTMLALCGGIVRMHYGELAADPVVDGYLGAQVTIDGMVTGEPDVRESSIRLPVRIERIDDIEVISGAHILAIVPLHTPVAYGDRVRISGELGKPEPFESGEGRLFDYPKFLAKDGISHILSFAVLEEKGENEGSVLKAGALALKQGYTRGLALSLKEPYAGLAGGITVGDKRGLGEALSETFRDVGLTHIIVLSGYNIMVVVEALMRWFGWLPKKILYSSGVVIAIFFAAITGFASASSRAAAMATISILGRATGRIYLASRALGLVALGMVMWNPYVVMFDPGFQLSVVATAGLIALTPHVASYIEWVPTTWGLREIAAASIGTQTAVLPLLLYQTGALSLVSLPVNLLVLMVIPFAMLFSAIAAAAGVVLGPLAPLVGLPAYVLLEYVIKMAELFASLPGAVISLPAFSVLWLVAAYALMALGGWWMMKKTAEHEAPR